MVKGAGGGKKRGAKVDLDKPPKKKLKKKLKKSSAPFPRGKRPD